MSVISCPICGRPSAFSREDGAPNAEIISEAMAADHEAGWHTRTSEEKTT